MLQHIDNGAASKKLELGLDLIDPRSSFIILHLRRSPTLRRLLKM